MEAIFLVGGGIERQLALRPKDVALFLSRFSPFMRFFLRLNLMSGAPIVIAQSFLDTPIQEILHQLQTRYAQELDHYHIQL